MAVRRRDSTQKAVLAVFAVLYALIFAVYLHNDVEPFVLGVSFPYFYVTAIYVAIVLLLIFAAAKVWR